MKKAITLLAITAFVVTVYSCRKNTNNNTNPAQSITLDLPASAAPYFNANTVFAPDSVNKVATLGRVLFYDTRLSANNAVACGSCHQQVNGFADNVALSIGFDGMPTKRNSLGITALSQSTQLFWDGREDNLKNLILRPITNHVEMGITDASVLPGKLAVMPYYGKLFYDAFGDSTITVDRISSAVSMFVQAIGPIGNRSRLDEYDNGNISALTGQEVYGKYLFDTKYNCTNCHGGAVVFNSYGGNGTFKDIGLDANYMDMGRGTITGNAADNGTFLVPNLRNVALTAPYMHDGRYKTLEEVVDHYSHGIMGSPNLDIFLRDSTGNPRQFNISETDKEAIVAFLKSMTDNVTIADPKFSNPFKVIN